MKYDEFAFLNQQLAAMVRDGIPLESALRRLCADMRQGPLRAELEKLEADLAKGTPLREAARARRLPELYRQMLEVGAQSNDLPGILTMLADHYQRRHVIWTRLKGLMVYPAIVLFGSFLLSVFLCLILNTMGRTVFVSNLFGRSQMSPLFFGFGIWGAPVVLGIAVVLLSVALTTPRVRRALRWRLSAFKEASLAQTASALVLMLRSGVPLDNALRLVEQLEKGTPAEGEVARWRQRLAAGQGKFSEMAEGGKVFPPLFVWTVSQSHEDLTSGFQRAAEIYQARATYRTELLLYSALPCSVMALGLVIMTQIQPVIFMFVIMMQTIGD
ncbi:MAG: type II secretion system F family protein [Verrucomicrobiota bacterium]|jgi:type IV pilus assembly protein PilC